jgi:hypothetical protein
MKEIANTMPSQTNTAAMAKRQLASTPAAYDSTPLIWARGILGSVDRDRVAELVRWEDAGATWQVVSRTARGVTIALMRCDGGEEVDRFSSDDPRLLAYVDGLKGPG